MAADYHLRVNYVNSANANQLGTGNLALANQNGQSLSTSALGTANASVDRWSIVMDMLAQSRAKDKSDASAESGGGGLPGGSGKRLSKQLDKFKSAAWSAAAASKHQRHYQQQQQQQVSPHDMSSSEIVDRQQQLVATNSSPLASTGSSVHQQQQQQQLYSQAPSHHLDHNHINRPVGGGYLDSVGVARVGGLHPNDPQQQQSGGPLHIHQTKSLPIGQAQQPLTGIQPTLGGGFAMVGQSNQQQQHPMDPDSMVALQQPPVQQHLTHQQQQQQQHHQPQQPMPYQLLNIGNQQAQSTSGKFILRFSLLVLYDDII